MSTSEDILSSLERQRVELEHQISDLQQSLYKWRVWDAEFDGLKEELSALDDNSSKEDILCTAKDYGGLLVTENEIKNLLGESQGVNRNRRQVIEVIERRVDYVRDNIRTLEKRIEVAEKKLLKMVVVEQPGGDLNEEGLPMTDIVEELDDAGRVISGSTTTPGRSAEEILEVLKRAGVKDIPEGNVEDSKAISEAESKGDPNPMGVDAGLTTDSKVTDANESTGRFEHCLADGDVASGSVSNIPTVGSTVSSQSVSERMDREGDIQMPELDESPEDAALRREILQYGLEEVGAVVAELEIDKSGSEFSISDEEYDDYIMSDEYEEEDEYGRATRRVLSDEYHRQMRDLEKKLNAKSLHNIGPDTSILPPEVRRGLEEPDLKPAISGKNEDKLAKKKKVAFADELDIAPDPSTLAPAGNSPESPRKPKASETPAIHDVVMEHSSAPNNTAIFESKPRKKASRFKIARAGEGHVRPEPVSVPLTTNSQTSRPLFRSKAPPVTPTLFPATTSDPKPFSQPIEDPDSDFSRSSTIADNLIEREVNDTSALPPDPEDFDEAFLKRQIATEFYNLRNRKIQQEGGFMREEDEPQIIPLDAESNSNKPRMSRFKSARVKRNSGS
ncbi:hypothetical protein CPC735_061010 [Coccidioides posadasii C735 delta SOWgp]|uniref:DUF3835 domain-containing protein n=1 Tax=Coccidioides posadasii (strain C735) TaxID=222929 RepID=C5P3G0_COCP7|nr:hypothetical protein CPC735_061010 [Coccidioides posadasii C735 delta SOWgp]EER28228.1 hypothetical protein CPC735_061010 [Coccidioides posadasii C735 delta SOWgp]|eukprot:XP_003070373.1 hypothetical protein CPC735_061010 [Coccidioides posadasii C735 delta SOWgp]